jgi:phenylpropionate dioxygenase-like ring-hydroxylating dioxygenase large terminal subunit
VYAPQPMSALDPVLVPPPTKRHVSVARLARHWYVACWSRELKSKPIARTVLGVPMVLFRGKDGPAALLDRCPHRNVPLSDGCVTQGTLQCPYHGWRFDKGGECVEVPGLLGEPAHKGRAAVSFPVREQDGFIWVYPDTESAPEAEPFTVPEASDSRYTTVRAEFTMEATLHATLENMLDVPHTAFLHGGLFRTASKRNEITARVTRDVGGVECQYIGEPRPTGVIGAILAPKGGVVEHYDRFVMPSVGQVEYRLGDRSHVVATQAMTPVGDFVTRCYALVCFRLPLPGWLIRPFVEPVARGIIKQDARILKAQTDNVQKFGGERFVSTEIDLLGPHIWHLLKRAERGELEGLEAVTREVRLSV